MEQLFAKALEAERLIEWHRGLLTEAEAAYLKEPTEKAKNMIINAREAFAGAIQYSKGMNDAIVTLGYFGSYCNYKENR